MTASCGSIRATISRASAAFAAAQPLINLLSRDLIVLSIIGSVSFLRPTSSIFPDASSSIKRPGTCLPEQMPGNSPFALPAGRSYFTCKNSNSTLPSFIILEKGMFLYIRRF